MKIGKIIRDLIVLGLVVAAFYLVIQTASLFSSPETVAHSDFSRERAISDRLVAEKKFAEAIPYLEQLIERDPYNAFALSRKASCLTKLHYQASVNGNVAEQQQLFPVAVAAFRPLLDFPQYAHTARYNIARMQAIEGEDENAIQTLREAVESGFYSRRGLGNYEVFAKFRSSEPFRAIWRQERRNAEDYRRRRQGNIRIQGGG